MVRKRHVGLTENLSLPEGSWDGLRAGSEYCRWLLPDAGVLKDLSERGRPAMLSLVTPLAGPGDIGAILEAVETAACLGWDEVVVNDWGVLEKVRGMDGLEITAGRLIMRLRRGPGMFDHWVELDDASKRYFTWGSLYDSPFLGFLREMGVTRLEVDPPRHWLPLPEVDGFSLSLHLEERFVTLSAVCPWQYDEKTGSWRPDEGCRQRCLAVGDIDMASDRLPHSLTLRTRATLEKVNEPVDVGKLPGNVDRIIFQGRGGGSWRARERKLAR